MIVSRSPVRITFGGGGTDIASYYSKRGGFLVAAAINRYTRVTASRGYYDYIHLKYSKEEKVQKCIEIGHPIFRETLKLLSQSEPIELISSSEVPAGCGLGSSGSFAVALIKALSVYQGKELSNRDIAEIACYIEIDLLGEPVGKQDQYASAFGGLNSYTFSTKGEVEVESLHITSMALEKLRRKLLLFDTGVERKASDVLSGVCKELETGDKTANGYDSAKDMAYEMKRLLQHSLHDDFGLLLDDYWKIRKKISNKVTNPFLDEVYETAIKNGALGGKLQGAGAGGFFMFYCPMIWQEKLIQALSGMGLKLMEYGWDTDGVQSYTV